MSDSLDEASLRNLDLLNQHLILNKQIETALKDGWLNLSKARYVMGYQQSLAAQFDKRDRPTSIPIEIVKSEKEPWPHYSIGEAADEDEVKKRFGLLNPSSAKHAKLCFQKCLQLAVELATLRAELVSNLDKGSADKITSLLMEADNKTLSSSSNCT